MKITARKYGGDDAYSWAIFVEDRPVVTGLTRREVPYHRERIRALIKVQVSDLLKAMEKEPER